MLYRVSHDFTLLFQEVIPKVIMSEKYAVNTGPILSGFRAISIWNVTWPEGLCCQQEHFHWDKDKIITLQFTPLNMIIQNVYCQSEWTV
jgi:hypothetical protein